MKTVKLEDGKQIIGKYAVIARCLGTSTARQIVRIIGYAKETRSDPPGAFGRIKYEFVRGPIKGRRATGAFIVGQEIMVWTRLGPEIDKWLKATKPSRKKP